MKTSNTWERIACFFYALMTLLRTKLNGDIEVVHSKSGLSRRTLYNGSRLVGLETSNTDLA
jgi:hypothetical protein